ncbi:hypothetical protein C8R45DRAFT_1089261 [Mycena sanguinolenta]|nr:hypothetical protein C8R45DRAFT_1089261 [Mycena sanguinolenta]
MAVVFAPNSFLVTLQTPSNTLRRIFGPHVIPHPFPPGVLAARAIQLCRAEYGRGVHNLLRRPCHGSTYLVMEHIADIVSFPAWIEASADEQERKE